MKINLGKISKNIINSKLITKAVNYYKGNSARVKVFLLLFVSGAMVLRGVMQQPMISENKAEIASITEQIEYEKSRQAEVENMRDMVETDEYIEKIAREKLGMIKANEKLFVDISKEK